MRLNPIHDSTAIRLTSIHEIQFACIRAKINTMYLNTKRIASILTFAHQNRMYETDL